MAGLSKIHATLTPNNINNPQKQDLVLKFDAPLKAHKVTVELVEMDAKIKGEGGQDDIIAIFDGKIHNKKFQGSLIRKTKPQSGAPSFRFKFEGGSVIQLQIPSGRGEKENGAFEIGVKVSGIVSRIPKIFISKAPAFIRGLPQAKTVASHRPVLTFQARKGKNRDFYELARKFWGPVSDGLEYQMSMEHIIYFLENNKHNMTKDNLAFGKWGEINIVSHANETGWASLPLFDVQRNKKVVRTDYKSLKKHSNNSNLKFYNKNIKGPTAIIDSKTSIIWRGCNVGRNQKFLDEIRKLFGGKCHVYGPKYLQGYGARPVTSGEKDLKTGKVMNRQSLTHSWEYFMENFYFDIPWRNPKLVKKKGWVKPKLPNEANSINKLKAKYKNYPNAPNDAEWGKLFRDKKSRHDSNKPMRYNMLLEFRKKSDYKKQARKDLKVHIDPDMGYNYSDYYWQIRSPKKITGGWKVLCRGTKYRIEVRRPLRDPNSGKIVVPDLNKSAHYGHSSP